MDINNAFLNGTLYEEVFMNQPLGFVDTNYPPHVCKLRKEIYGLKQAPCAWFTELKKFLLLSSFKNSLVDTTLFLYLRDGILVYLLVYLEDIIHTDNNSSLLNKFIFSMLKNFSLKDLGTFNYFLGVDVLPTATCIFLSKK